MRRGVPRYRLALVRVAPAGAAGDEVRYLDDPFQGVELGDLAATGIRLHWDKAWAKGAPRTDGLSLVHLGE